MLNQINEQEYRTSVSNLKLNNNQFNIIDTMSFRCKALYNTGLYLTEQYRKEVLISPKTYTDKNGKIKNRSSYIGYIELDKLIKTVPDSSGNILYKSIPASLAQQTLMKLDKNYKSFFNY